jgi:hypothetical protein
MGTFMRMRDEYGERCSSVTAGKGRGSGKQAFSCLGLRYATSPLIPSPTVLVQGCILGTAHLDTPIHLNHYSALHHFFSAHHYILLLILPSSVQVTLASYIPFSPP